MSSLKETRNRIKSVKSTRQITKAMQMVASVKMRKAQDKSSGSRPYAEVAWEILGNLIGIVGKSEHPLLDTGVSSKKGRVGILVISSNRGLCGGLNAKVLKEALSMAKEKDVEFITIGKKARDFLRLYKYHIAADFSEELEKAEVDMAQPIVRLIVDEFLAGKYTKIHLIYTHFVSTLSQEPKTVRLLPFDKENFSDIVTEDYKSKEVQYTFEPSAEEVLSGLITRVLEIKVYQAILENLASEHSARMVAMKNATDNAGELADDLTLYANKLRQSNITKELAEIVGGSL